MRTMRLIGLVGLAVVGVLGAYVLVNIASVIVVAAHHDGAEVDAIVVMGAAQYDGVPSEQLASRLDHALALWRRGRAPVIAVTGGKKEGDRFTEAATSRRYLTDRGVPAEAILAEEQGRSTWESLATLAPILRAEGISSVVVVSNGFHLQRSLLTIRELGFRAVGDGTSRDPFPTGEALLRSVREGAGISLGRIIGFERLWRLTG